MSAVHAMLDFNAGIVPAVTLADIHARIEKREQLADFGEFVLEVLENTTLREKPQHDFLMVAAVKYALATYDDCNVFRSTK